VALARIEMGGYGVCIDCGDDIAIERLRAYPTSIRCLSCQSKYEGSHASTGTPSL
jgi:DnaK suppressor protein